jgi:hypothetical protein
MPQAGDDQQSKTAGEGLSLEAGDDLSQARGDLIEEANQQESFGAQKARQTLTEHAGASLQSDDKIEFSVDAEPEDEQRGVATDA